MKESKIEARFKDRCEALDGWCIKMYTLSVSGLPDRIVLMPGGKIYLVEMKTIRNGKPTELSRVQQVVHAKLRTLGFKVWRIYDSVTMDLFFETIKKEI